MTYQQAMVYMEQIGKRGSILGLTTVKELLERLGNPQDMLSVIHVAGTNGKGSICTCLEVMYRAEGKKTGRYISPTLHGYLERFQIDGRNMEEQEFVQLLERVIPVLENMEQETHLVPTAFELETALAFLYFLEKQVELVILETGMGGAKDATNVVRQPLCTVFSSIGMDHMQFLGNTVEEIAKVKAGIMREQVPVVSYPNTQQVINVLRQEYNGKEFHVVDADKIQIVSETLEGSRFLYKGQEYAISLPGEYQIYNAATAIETKLLLDGSLKKESLMTAYWEGRFEKISDEPLLVKDGAHNVDGVQALKKTLEKHFTNANFLFIIGVLKDKDYENMVKILCPMAHEVFTITPSGQRGLSGTVLAQAVKPYCSQVRACATLEEAKQLAVSEWYRQRDLGKKPVIVAWGSLSYIGELV